MRGGQENLTTPQDSAAVFGLPQCRGNDYLDAMANEHHTKRRVFGVAATVLGMALGLALAEGAVRWLAADAISLLVKDPVVGQRYRPGFARTIYVREADREIFERFNREGFRGPDYRIEHPPSPVRRIAVLGDSFIAGIGVDEGETFCRQLEKSAALAGEKWEVMNFGVSGFGTAQEYLVWRDIVRAYRPDIVVVCFFDGNDLADNCRQLTTGHRPYFTLGSNGDIELLPMAAGRVELTRWLTEHSFLFAWHHQRVQTVRGYFRRAAGAVAPRYQVFDTEPGPAVREAWQITERILSRWQTQVREGRTRLVLVSIPAPEEVVDAAWDRLAARIAPAERSRYWRDHPQKQLEGIAARQGIPYIPLQAALREAERTDAVHFFRDEEWGHWSPGGCRAAASAALPALREGIARRPGDRAESPIEIEP